MAEKNNATCSICGRGYYMCLSCKDVMKLNPWKKHTDTSEHYKIYQVVHGYSTGVYSKEEAKLKLQMVDLSDYNSFRDNIKHIIDYIFVEDKVEKPVIEEEAVVTEVEEPKAIRKRRTYKVVETE